jgi:hypothetical protein
MRKASTLVGLTLFALTATARAQEAAPAAGTPTASNATAASTPAPEATQAAASRRKIQVGLSFLPMAMGKYTTSDISDVTTSSDAYFAYGFGLSAGYEVLPGLIVGFAPQVLFGVQPKPSDAVDSIYAPAVKQYDLMARVAYMYRVVDTISVYAEVLPGYSLIPQSGGASAAKGLVLAFGAGGAMDLTDQFFVNLGLGYQIGFQSDTEGVHTTKLRTKYIRVALGGGVKF